MKDFSISSEWDFQVIQKILYYFGNKIEDLENRSRCSHLKNYSYYREKRKRRMIGFITTLIIRVIGGCVFPHKWKMTLTHGFIHLKPREHDKPCVTYIKTLTLLRKIKKFLTYQGKCSIKVNTFIALSCTETRRTVKAKEISWRECILLL